MALIENLVVALGLKTSNFDSKLKKSQQQLSTFGKIAGGLKSKMMGMVAGAAAAAGAMFTLQKTISSFNRARTELDALGKAATKLGVGTKELGAMQYAAQQAGMEIGSFNTSVQRMLKRIAYATQGKGEGVAGFKMLGLDPKELLKMDLTSSLEAQAKAFAKIGTQAERIGIAAKIYDSEGVAILNLLQSDLTKAARKAEELGIAFNRFDVAKVELMNDSIQDLDVSLKSTWKRLAIEIAPAIITITRHMLGLTKTTRIWAQTNVDGGGLVLKTYGFLNDAIILLTTNLRISIGVIKVWKGAFALSMAEIDKALTSVEKAGKDFYKALGGGFGREIQKQFDLVKMEMNLLMRDLDKKPPPIIAMSAGSEKNLTPAALRQGTREAVVAAAKAGTQTKAEKHLSTIEKDTKEVKTTLVEARDLARDIYDAIYLPAGITEGVTP